jgi:hypothetical protein
MTKSERRQVAAMLREWAAWCEANPGALWSDASVDDRSPRADLTFWVADRWCTGEGLRDIYRGATAATGLLLAAAAVEAGDVP